MEKIYAMVHHCLVEDHEKVDCFAVNEVSPYYSLTEVLTKLHNLYCEVAYGSEKDERNDPGFEQTVLMEYAYDNIYPIVRLMTKGPNGFRREDVYEVHALPTKKQES